MKTLLTMTLITLSLSQVALAEIKVTATLTGKDAKPFIDLLSSNMPDAHISYSHFGCGLPNSPQSYYEFESAIGKGGSVNTDILEIYKVFKHVGVKGNSTSNASDTYKAIVATSPSSFSVENFEIFQDDNTKALTVRFSFDK